jgi:hypothetical protein
MAKVYRKRKVTRHEYKEKITCDFCKQEIKGAGSYNRDEVTIEAKFGNVFPEGDHRTVAELDCCTECFAEKVRPCIEEHLGVQFREHDADEFFASDFAGPIAVEELGEVAKR